MPFEFPKKLPKEWIEGFERNGRVGSEVHGLKVGTKELDPNFGYETKGGTELAPAGNYINGSWYSCLDTGDADSITVYLKQKFENLPKIKCAIYKKSDGALVGYTEEWTLTSGWDGWKTFNIVSGGSLTAQDYWLVFWANNLVCGYEDAETNKGLYKNLAYDGFPDPLTGFSLIARKWSIYCTYTAGGGPTEKSFADSGGGSDAFINPYRAMPFTDVGHGAEAFNTPFRAMGFADVGHGGDAFIALLQKAFSDSGLGLDAFAKEIYGFITKDFSDVGHGVDAFIILLKGLGFSDSGHGTDAFIIPYRAMGFSDIGHGTDAFLIVFKTVFFSDVGHGSDSFGSYIPGAVKKMKLSLVIGDLAIQISGD